MSIKKVIASIKKNNNFLITAHTNLEGDALGSQLSFYRLLKALGKNAAIVNDDNIPYGYEFLPGLEQVKRFKKGSKNTKFDCFVILDCSDLKRCGGLSKINLNGKTVINIDHHISNERFGHVNWVEPRASSTAEMIYQLYKRLGVPFDKDTALFLYVGLLTDTGSFHYSNTAPSTLKAAAELLKFDLDVAGIYKHIYENIPFPDIKLLTQLFPTIKRAAAGRIAWCQIENSKIRGGKPSIDLTERLLGFIRAIKDVEVAVLLKQSLSVNDEIRVNLRSQGKVDVNIVAGFFGGGGHKTASACTIKGEINAVGKRVINKIKENLK